MLETDRVGQAIELSVVKLAAYVLGAAVSLTIARQAVELAIIELSIATELLYAFSGGVTIGNTGAC